MLNTCSKKFLQKRQTMINMKLVMYYRSQYSSNAAYYTVCRRSNVTIPQYIASNWIFRTGGHVGRIGL